MKKLVLSAAFAALLLSGCISQVSQSITSVLDAFTPLSVEDFCKAKADNLAQAQERYSGKKYVYSGTLSTVQKEQGHAVLGLNATGGGSVWAKVENYDGRKIGSKASIEGVISPSNFNGANRNKCHVLLDSASMRASTL